VLTIAAGDSIPDFVHRHARQRRRAIGSTGPLHKGNQPGARPVQDRRLRDAVSANVPCGQHPGFGTASARPHPRPRSMPLGGCPNTRRGSSHISLRCLVEGGRPATNR
jgi:hypothetical protein